jgi:hypothetical protein
VGLLTRMERYLVLGPALVYALYHRDGTTFTDYYRADILSLKHIGFGPLWFVEALLIFNFIYAGWKAIFRRAGDSAARAFPSPRAMLAAALLTGAAAFCLRLVWPVGTDILGMQLGYFASYVLLFALGIAAWRNGWLEEIPARTARIWSLTALAALILLPVIIVSGGALTGNGDSFSGGVNPQALSYACREPFVAFGIILFLLTRFRRHLDRAGMFSRALSESSYTAYIIHPPVIVGMGLLAHGLATPPLLKFALVGAAGVAACFSLSYGITRIPGTRRVL